MYIKGELYVINNNIIIIYNMFSVKIEGIIKISLKIKLEIIIVGNIFNWKNSFVL